MTDPVTIVIPGTPRGKGRPQFSGKTKTAYTPAGTRSYEDLVGRMATVAMRGKDAFTGPLHLDMKAHFIVPVSWPASKRSDAIAGLIKPIGKPDLDNIIKAISDGMQNIVFRDDAAIVSVSCSKVYAAGDPFVVATVKQVQSLQSVQSVNRVSPTLESAES